MSRLDSRAQTPDAEGALSDLTIVDIASEMTAHGTKILAELGAEVIRVEPPQGERLRYRGPFYHGRSDVESSLRHQHFNANKRSVTLDISQARGAELLLALAGTADVLVEACPPGYLSSLGLGFDHLQAVNPHLIVVSVTPFGQQGPHSHYLATDIVGAAMGGLTVLNGFPEDPPVTPGAEQAYHMAGLVASTAVMVAVCRLDSSPDRRGAHLDISMQDCVAMTIIQTGNANFYTWHGRVPNRRGLAVGGGRFIFQCKDGWVSLVVPPHMWDVLLSWLGEFGLQGELTGKDWRDYAYRVAHDGPVSEAMASLCSRYTRSEVYHEAQRRRLLCTPVNTVADLLEDPQLEAWGLFTDYDHPALGGRLRDVGPPYRSNETPNRIGRAPMLGEDNEAILGGRLGLSPVELARLRAEGIV